MAFPHHFKPQLFPLHDVLLRFVSSLIQAVSEYCDVVHLHSRYVPRSHCSRSLNGHQNDAKAILVCEKICFRCLIGTNLRLVAR